MAQYRSRWFRALVPPGCSFALVQVTAEALAERGRSAGRSSCPPGAPLHRTPLPELLSLDQIS